MYIMGFNMLFAVTTIITSSNKDIGRIMVTINLSFEVSIWQIASHKNVYIINMIEKTI